ncbi:MAG TPA: hypothetical protein VFQ23_21310 [Anaerolineales bacterium]|nr:hypothetical protein [Anaerolineales bacterium]
MNTILLSILLGLSGMVGWGVYDFLGGAVSILPLAFVVNAATSIPGVIVLLVPLECQRGNF